MLRGLRAAGMATPVLILSALGGGRSRVDAVARHHGGTLELGDARPGLIATLHLPATGPA